MTEPGQTKLNIAYLCDFDPGDRHSYSGGNTRIFETLQTHVGRVTPLPISWGLAEPLRKAVLAAPETLSIRARWRMHLALARVIAPQIKAALRKDHFDVLFCAYSFHSLSRLNLPYPMVTAYSSDATPTIYKQSEVGQSFGSHFKPSRLIDPMIEAAEARVFRQLDLALWPSDWLRDATIDRYGLSPQNALTVPWGANVPDPGPAEGPPIGSHLPLNILLVGRDWAAKGGWLTAETVSQLRRDGIDAHLTVIGCQPPNEVMADWVHVYPHLDKSKPQDMQIFQDCFRHAHFLVMPSMESYGFAFCEASAYGLPSLCLKAGGVPVWDRENGYAIPIGSKASDFASLIENHLSEPDRYRALRQSARAIYEDRLNWPAWGRRVQTLLRDRVNVLNAPSRAEPRRTS